jgi:hypothetical protein
VHKVNKSASCTATTAIIKTDTGNTTLATATFSSNTATFTTPYKLNNATHYRIELNS